MRTLPLLLNLRALMVVCADVGRDRHARTGPTAVSASSRRAAPALRWSTIDANPLAAANALDYNAAAVTHWADVTIRSTAAVALWANVLAGAGGFRA